MVSGSFTWHSPRCGFLRCMYLQAASAVWLQVTKLWMNSHVQVFVWTRTFVTLSTDLGSELPNLMAILNVTSEELSNCFPKQLHHFSFQQLNEAWKSPHPHTTYFCLSHFGHPSGCEGGIIVLHLHWRLMKLYTFPFVYWPLTYLLWEICSNFCPFLMGLFIFSLSCKHF
jgi:hypothetical protein